MKIISITKTWQGEELCIPSLESVYPYMHRMIYINNEFSWRGHEGNTVFPLIGEWKARHDKADKIINERNGYEVQTQEEQYQEALKIADEYDYDYLMLIDTDEVWASKDIEAAIKYLEQDTEHLGFKSAMYSYVKSPFYRIVPYDKLAPVVFIRKGAGINGCRGCKTDKQTTIPGIEFHHFCSVRKSLEAVWSKHVASCTEESEPMVDKAEWINNVWNKLPNAKNILPLKNHTANWQRAEQISLLQLPETMRTDPFTLAFQGYNFNMNFNFQKYEINKKDGFVDYDIVIPTFKHECDMEDKIRALRDTLYKNTNIIITSLEASAATNRNMGLLECDKDYVVMIDDDVLKLPPLFAETLVNVLRNNPDAVMVSARLCNMDGTPGPMMDIKNDLTVPIMEVKERALPTACVAIRNNGTMFDEAYIGSGFEDTDYSFQLREQHPEGKWFIHNEVRVVHMNEMKNQHGDIYYHNARLFKSKWHKNINQRERA